MAIITEIFVGDGSTKEFTVSSTMLSKSHVRVDLYYGSTGSRDDLDATDHLVPESLWDVLSATVLFDTAPANNYEVRITVSSDGTGLDTAPTVYATVVSSITEILALSAIIDSILSVETIKAEIVSLDSIKVKLESLYADKATLDSLYADKVTLDTLFSIKIKLDSLYADKATLDSLYADKTKLDAIYANLTDIVDTQLRAWEAEAERLTAESYATEAEDTPVNIVTSDGDGTFTYTPTSPAEYSALHYSLKAKIAAASEPILANDLDIISVSGSYYTDATTANRIITIDDGVINVILDHLQIDSNSAIQRTVDYNGNHIYFRGKVAGVWQQWQKVVSSDIATTSSVPTVADDNVITEVDTSTVTGWTGSPTTDGTTLTFPDAAGGTVNYEYTISTLSGDYIEYMSVRAESIANSYVHFVIGGAGDGRIQLSLGYNWETAASEQNRVSVNFGGTGVQGPLIDYSVNTIDVAIQYDSSLLVGNLFIKENGAWVFYGSAAMTDPYRTTIRVTSAGVAGGYADGFVDEWFLAKPNFVAIGDSVTAGAVLFDPDPSTYAGDDNYNSTWMSHANPYPNVRNNLIVNYGIGSNTSTQVEARINTVLTATTPRVVFLSACNNDYGASISYTTRTSNIQSSVDKIVAASATPVLYNAIYPNSTSPSYPANADYYREWWETYSDTITSTFFNMDTNVPVKDGTGSIDPAYAADHVHPNVTGYTLIGEYFTTFFDTSGVTLDYFGAKTIEATVNFVGENIPTVDPVVKGYFWNDAGTLKISAGV